MPRPLLFSFRPFPHLSVLFFPSQRGVETWRIHTLAHGHPYNQQLILSPFTMLRPSTPPPHLRTAPLRTTRPHALYEPVRSLPPNSPPSLVVHHASFDRYHPGPRCRRSTQHGERPSLHASSHPPTPDAPGRLNPPRPPFSLPNRPIDQAASGIVQDRELQIFPQACPALDNYRCVQPTPIVVAPGANSDACANVGTYWNYNGSKNSSGTELVGQ